MNNYFIDKKEKNLRATIIIQLAIIFMASMNFVNRYFYCIYIAFLFLAVIKTIKFPMHKEAWSLAILGAGLLIFDRTATTQLTNMIKPFTYLLCYLLGYNFIKLIKDKRNSEKLFLLLIFVIMSGNFVYMMLNRYVNTGIQDRSAIDFWTRGVKSATLQAMMGCLTIAVTCAVVVLKTKLRYKLVLILATVMVMSYNLMLAGRTLIVLLPIMMMLSLGHLFSVSGISKTYKIRIFITILCVILLLVTFYANNTFSLRSTVENSNIYNRFFGEYAQELDEDQRSEHKIDYIRNMIDYPFGGRKIMGVVGGYAHDLYLDTYDIGGIIPFAAVLIFIIGSLQGLLYMLKNKEISFEIKNISLCVYSIMNFMFFMEPILEGTPWFFGVYCIIAGANRSLITMEQVLKKEEKE